MYARSSTLGILSLLLLSLPGSQTGRFDLQSSGAVNLVVAGTEARYGLIPTEVNGRPVISVSLGATQGQGSLTLTVWGDEVPPAGRYGITESWEDRLGAPAFRASFIAGSVERPIGAFRGESGWVRITERAPSHICGEFEIRARGFLGSKPDQENHYVTVRGRFQAQGDGTTLQSVSIQ
jgi:hypothetical protein